MDSSSDPGAWKAISNGRKTTPLHADAGETPAMTYAYVMYSQCDSNCDEYVYREHGRAVPLQIPTRCLRTYQPSLVRLQMSNMEFGNRRQVTKSECTTVKRLYISKQLLASWGAFSVRFAACHPLLTQLPQRRLRCCDQQSHRQVRRWTAATASGGARGPFSLNGPTSAL